MDTTYLEVDQLCYEGEATRDVINNDGNIRHILHQLYLPFQMALDLWRATGNEETFFHRLSLAEQTITTSYEGLTKFDKEMGIQKELATQICKLFFQNDIAKLTLEIAEPRILKVEKDKSVTFAGMLGTIGKCVNLSATLGILEYTQTLFGKT